MNGVARRRRLPADDPDDASLHLGKHLEVDGEKVADHRIGCHLLESFLEIAGFLIALADDLNEIRVIIARLPDELDRFIIESRPGIVGKVILSDQSPSFLVRQSMDIQGRGKSVKKRRGIFLLLGERPQSDGRGDHRTDVLPGLHGPAKLAQQRRILPVELDQLLHLVAKQQQLEIPGAQLSP